MTVQTDGTVHARTEAAGGVVQMWVLQLNRTGRTIIIHVLLGTLVKPTL